MRLIVNLIFPGEAPVDRCNLDQLIQRMVCCKCMMCSSKLKHQAGKWNNSPTPDRNTYHLNTKMQSKQ
eukprot:6485722-Amphidinium_carterae.1